MNMAALGPALQEVFKPLFDELEQLQEPLDRDEFVDATNRLYDTLPQNEKNMILRFGKKQKEKDFELENCTFKPKTNSYVNSQLLSNPASHYASQSNVGKSVASIKRPGSAHPTQSTQQVNRSTTKRLTPATAHNTSAQALTKSLYTSNVKCGGSIMDKILKERKVNEDLGVLESGAVEATSTIKKKKVPDVIQPQIIYQKTLQTQEKERPSTEMSISAAPSGNISAFMNSSYALPKASHKKSGRKTSNSTQKVEIPARENLPESFEPVRASLSPSKRPSDTKIQKQDSENIPPARNPSPSPAKKTVAQTPNTVCSPVGQGKTLDMSDLVTIPTPKVDATQEILQELCQ